MPNAVKPQGMEFDIRELAKAFEVSAVDVHNLLWDQIHQLEATARIRDYVPQLAIKHVKDYLHNTSARESYHVSQEVGSERWAV